MKVVDGISEGRDTLKEVRGGGGCTISVDTGEDGEGGGGSTGRKIMLVGFCFIGASCGTSESSSSESNSDDFRAISIGGGGTN